MPSLARLGGCDSRTMAGQKATEFRGTLWITNHIDRFEVGDDFPWPIMSAFQVTTLELDIDLLGDLDGVIDLDAKVANRTLDLRMPAQQLHHS